MQHDQTTMERLVFVKSLHQEGIEQSTRPMPMASMSVLTFHDAVELFLYLSAEEVDAHNSSNIMSYWNDIKQKSGIELFGKAGINRLREARVGLKHYGNRPSMREIESFRSTIQSFFEENTPKVFDIEYAEVSLSHLVQFEDTKEHLLKADELKSKNRLAEAMGELKLAHETLISEYKERSLWELDYDTFPRYSGTGSPPPELETMYSSLGLDDMNRALDNLSDALVYMNSGIQFDRYARFEHLTPRLIHNQDSENRFGKHRPALENYEINDSPEGTYTYCLDFMIELSLSLQNTDFDFDSELVPDSNSVFDF